MKVCTGKCACWDRQGTAGLALHWATPLGITEGDRSVLALALARPTTENPVIRLSCGFNMRISEDLCGILPARQIIYMRP